MLKLEVTGKGEITMVGDKVLTRITPMSKVEQLKRYTKSAKKIKKEIKVLNRVKGFTTKASIHYDQLNDRVCRLGKQYSRTTQKIYNLKKELGYLNNETKVEDVPIIISDKCLYKTPEVVGRMVKVDCCKADLKPLFTTDDVVYGYVIDYSSINGYLVEVPDLINKLHNGHCFKDLKLTGKKYWYCGCDCFEFVD